VPKSAEPKEFTSYVNRPETPVQELFADWLEEVCELEFATAKAKQAFRLGVRLSKVLIMDFQASEANRALRAERKTAAEAAAEEAKEAAPKKVAKKAAPKTTKKAAKVAEEAAEEDGEEVEEAPAPVSPKKVAKRVGKRAAAPATEEEAPF